MGRASQHGHPSLCPGKEHASCRGCGVRYSTPNTLWEGRDMRKPVGWDEGAFASVLGSLCYWKVAHCQMEAFKGPMPDRLQVVWKKGKPCSYHRASCQAGKRNGKGGWEMGGTLK